jgi:hypothetical protein
MTRYILGGVLFPTEKETETFNALEARHSELYKWLSANSVDAARIERRKHNAEVKVSLQESRRVHQENRKRAKVALKDFYVREVKPALIPFLERAHAEFKDWIEGQTEREQRLAENLEIPFQESSALVAVKQRAAALASHISSLRTDRVGCYTSPKQSLAGFIDL